MPQSTGGCTQQRPAQHPWTYPKLLFLTSHNVSSLAYELLCSRCKTDSEDIRLDEDNESNHSRGSVRAVRRCEARFHRPEHHPRPVTVLVLRTLPIIIDSGFQGPKVRFVLLSCCVERGATAVALLLTNHVSVEIEAIATRLHICDNLDCARKPCLCFLKRHSVTLLSIF